MGETGEGSKEGADSSVNKTGMIGYMFKWPNHVVDMIYCMIDS